MPSTTRANFPSVYAFSLVSPPPPNTPHASGPCSVRVRDSSSAIRSSASSQPAGSSTPALRIRGEVSRTPGESSAGAVRPLPHRAPRFTGKSGRSVTSTGLPPPSGVGVRFIPHCKAQYGQWVGVAVVCIPVSLRRPCYAAGRSPLHGRHGDLPAGTGGT